MWAAEFPIRPDVRTYIHTDRHAITVRSINFVSAWRLVNLCPWKIFFFCTDPLQICVDTDCGPRYCSWVTVDSATGCTIVWLRFDWYDMIYLLTAIGLSPGCSSTVHIYTQTIHRATQQLEECRPCPVLASKYPGICLTTEEKARKNLSQGSRV